jgi:hypothetical protein
LREERRLRVFEKRVLRRILGLKRGGVTGEWRKLHNEELNDLYCSPNIVGVIKSRRMRLAGHVAHMGEGRSIYRILVGKSEENGHLEVQDVDEGVILKWITKNCEVKAWNCLIWFRGRGEVR